MLLKSPDLKLKRFPMRPNDGYPVLTGKGLIVMGMSPENTDLFDAFNAGIKWLCSSKTNADSLARNGMTNQDYLVPPAMNSRIGVDRDDRGNIVGAWAHSQKNFSSLFV